MQLSFQQSMLLFCIATSITPCCQSAYDNYRSTQGQGLSLKQLKTIAQWEQGIARELACQLK